MKPSCHQLAADIVELRKLQAELNAWSVDDSDFYQVEKIYQEIENRLLKVREQISISPEQAEMILGQDYLGPKAIQETFGFVPENIPPIPFAKARIERAKELGQFLVLRVNQTPDGELLNMKTIAALVPRQDASGQTLFANLYLRQDEAYYAEAPTLGWALATKELVPGSISKNYLEQTEALIDYLKTKIFVNQPLPEKYQKAIEEFESQKSTIRELAVSFDLSRKQQTKATEMLESLAIVQLVRHSPIEALYDILVYYKHNNVRLLEHVASLTRRRAPRGEMVGVGRFDAEYGMNVIHTGPGWSLTSINDGAVYSETR
ncbi:hypothetical protein EPO05_02265 [Patescibacteria group bacterium]|nr:MAG: hypothetical protein EPO05_02265 [Patescibacteria group bacterium]